MVLSHLIEYDLGDEQLRPNARERREENPERSSLHAVIGAEYVGIKNDSHSV